MAHRISTEGGVQCGICTPGFVITATWFLGQPGRPEEPSAAAAALAGNLCRCTGYLGILRGVEAAARDLEQAASA